MKFNNIGVFCGSSEGKNIIYAQVAKELGSFLAQRDVGIVYGGAKIGIMGDLADGALAYAGRVIGVIPDFLKSKEVAHGRLTELITVETMHERKTRMSDLSDGFMVLPGGFGTMEEFFEILTWAQLGLHSKPIGLLNVNHYYDPLVDFLDKMVEEKLVKEAHRNMVLIGDEIQDLFHRMELYKPPQIEHWISETGKT